MKKVCACLFVGFIFVLLIGCGVNTARNSAEIYAGYGAGIRGFLLTGWDAVQEDSLCQHSLLHDYWIDLSGGMQRIAGADVILDDGRTIYRTKRDSVTFLRGNGTYTSEDVEGIQAMKTAADKVGTTGLFISIPRKTCYMIPFSARGVEDPSPEWLKTDMDVFRESGYAVLDLHEKMHDQELDHAALYYRTDHHWNVYGAFWAARETAEALGIDASLLQKDQFETESYPKLFLGSEGRHCGRLYCGRDDFDILIPKYRTDFTIDIKKPDKQLRTGSFDEAMLFRENISRDYYNEDPYGVFLGDSQVLSIMNHQQPTGKHVVLIKDSYANSMASYFALLCRRVDLLDLRYFDGSVSEYIQKEKPDAFCVMVSMYTGKRYAEIQ